MNLNNFKTNNTNEIAIERQKNVNKNLKQLNHEKQHQSILDDLKHETIQNIKCKNNNAKLINDNFNDNQQQGQQQNHQQQQIDGERWKNLPIVILWKIFSYLEDEDRIRASTTCNQWRYVLFNSILWPKKYLNVNLCPHKFSIKLNCNENIKNNNRQLNHESIANNNNNNNCHTGFETYRLEDSFIYQQHVNVNSNSKWYSLTSTSTIASAATSHYTDGYNRYYYPNNRKKPNRKNFNEQLKNFIRKCSRFLNGITFYFDPNSSHNVLDLIKIIKFLSENEIAIYELNQKKQQHNYANCRNLKYFSIVPVTTLVRCVSDRRFQSLYSGLTEAIKFLFSKCKQLRHVSLGNLNELLKNNLDELYLNQFLKTTTKFNLKCLHLNSIRPDIYQNQYQLQQSYNNYFNNFNCNQQITSSSSSSTSSSAFIIQQGQMKSNSFLNDTILNFQQLTNLSLDFDVINTNLIRNLSKLAQLISLTINVHRLNRYHNGIQRQAWSLLIDRLPNLRVTLNLLHTDSLNFQILFDSLFNTEMPLKIFRAYYLDFKDENSSTIFCNMLDAMSRNHLNTLETVILIDNLNNPKNHLKYITPNVLVMLCWRCKNLINLTVIGYEITELDIIAMARLRGESLQSFLFAASCIQLNQYQSKYGNPSLLTNNYELSNPGAQRLFKLTVSKPLKRSWEPLPMNQIPQMIYDGFLPQTTYHRTIVEQTNGHSCCHSD